MKMLNMLVLLGVFLPLFIPLDLVTHKTNHEFDDYIQEFEYDMGIKVNSRIIRGKLSRTTAGHCVMLFKLITISDAYLNIYEYNKTEIRSTIYHELGHCECNILHDNRKKKDSCPESLMYHDIISDVCLHKYWPEYITKLKRDCKGS